MEMTGHNLSSPMLWSFFVNGASVPLGGDVLKQLLQLTATTALKNFQCTTFAFEDTLIRLAP